ncbi:MAG TPA: biotin--[acetyl-CoA-carboxylase] ligase [Candidatus Methylomirabilis sp.]|nr:biotin--[acetyl-CoA-carboxylase] ligase [Candidatus Methylomirabilis sp.]
MIPADIGLENIEAALRARIIGRPLQVVAEIGSTNDAVMEAARAGEPEGFAILADRQTAGRGRRGRSWVSPAGVGVYTSVLLRPQQLPARIPLLTLVGGLAVAEAIQEIARVAARLKWPNDVLVEGRKIAGVLTEMASTDGEVGPVVIGMGINVNHGPQDFPAELLPVATSLALVTGKTLPRGKVAAAVFNALDGWYQVFREGDDAAILTAGRERSAILGRPVDLHTGEGHWQGIAVDLDSDGALLVQEEGAGLRRVIAGDVSIRTPG